MWSRRGLRVILHGEEWELAVAYPFDSAVIQVQMCDLEVGRARNFFGVSNHCKAMVLRRDEDLVRAKIPNRMIAAAMAIRELGGLPP